MSGLKRPDRWFALALMLLAAGGAVALYQPGSVVAGEREATYFRSLQLWQSAFDALSAACGVGLLLRDFESSYTERGRWILAAIGTGGALLYLLANWQAVRRAGPSLTTWRSPGAMFVLVSFAGLILVSVAMFVGIRPAQWRTQALAGVCVSASLGFAPAEARAATAWAVPLCSWLAALGWSSYALLVPSVARACLRVRAALWVLVTYSALLLVAALLIALLEQPRGDAGLRSDAPPMAGQQPGQASTAWLALLQEKGAAAISAAGSGVATIPLGDRQTSDGTLIVLSLVVLLGPVGLSAGGGVSWMLWLWAAFALLAGRHARASAELARWCHAGLVTVVAIFGLALVGALGLLTIESLTASGFTPAPTFAEALMDASSAVGGAGLSAGLTAAVTSPNLASGLNQPINLYAFGMLWLMLLMLLGRLLPLLVLSRLSESEEHARGRDRQPAA